MNILLSAYACEPNKGSEASVGWNWAIELSRLGHEVWVLTRESNRAAIESFLEAQSGYASLHFIYFDLPKALRFWKKGVQGVQVYYWIWQLCIFFIAKNLMNSQKFDVIHQVTFVSVRFPSLLGLLGVPFIFGPVSGGERAPMALRKSFPLKGWLWDLLRDILNTFIWFDPWMHLTFLTADSIYVTSKETRHLIPFFYQAKVKQQLAIGINVDSQPVSQKKINPEKEIKILYVGNLLYLKGIHLALRAFSEFQKDSPGSKFVLIGDGGEREWLKQQSRDLGIETNVQWLGRMPQEEVLKQYPLFDVFLFPSLHDSGGMVILEAMSQDLPVICLDLGGPGVIVDETCGLVIPTENQTESDVVNSIRGALVKFIENPLWREQLSLNAKARAFQFQWQCLVQSIYHS
jgi:glycosyltransferase involved in cell wall biosynthesis